MAKPKVKAIETVGDLIPDPLNARKHNPRNIGMLEQALQEVGAARSIVIDERGVILAGNGVIEAAGQAGLEKVIVVDATGDEIVAVRRTGLTEEQKLKLALYDNRAPELSEFNLEVLEQYGKKIDLSGLWREDEWDGLFASRENPFPVVYVKINSLKAHPQNYREHPRDQIEHLIESIKASGFIKNIVIARENTILAGHGAVKAAVEMGKKHVPVIRLDLDPLEPRALKILLSDNEITNLAFSDDRALTELLKNIMTAAPQGLLGTGYDEQSLAALTFNTRPASEVRDKNEAAEWVGMPEYGETTEPFKLNISFLTEADRNAFIEKTGLRIDKKEAKAWQTRWPWTDREDLASVRFENSHAS